jgi:histone acetyltransferase SAS3
MDDETQQSDNQEEEEGDEAEAEQETNGNADEPSPSSSRSGRNSLRESVQKVARELLPAQRGAKPNAHSIYNQLVLDDDPMDGSRNLRKRKASTTEPEEHVMSLRKRRKSTIDPHSNEATNGTIESAGPRSTRPLRLKLAPQASAEIIKITRNSLLVTFTAKPAVLRKIFSKTPKGLKKRRGRRAGGGRRGSTARARRGTATATDDVAALPPLTAPFISTSYSQPFYSFYDKEADEFKGKPYGGVLTEAEADTSRTLPTSEDRRRFDEAKQQAEEAWRERLLAMQAEAEIPVRKPARKVSGPASQIECIEFGGWEIDTWYAAPYPEEYSRNRVLYICEFCLKYMNSDYVAWRHKLKCPAKHPPGDEIYRHGSVSVFEVDGRKNPVYCQNLCLLAKLFLGSKTLYYDVEPFLFYILCEYDDLGYHFVGYFSKEKRESSQNNVSCILTLPIHQRKGYGNLLIDFSYLLTRVEQKTGSPEKPLSDMGLVSYRSYWRLIICRYFLQHISADRSRTRGLSIKDISEDTGLTADDVVSALEALRFFVRDPQTGLYALRVDFEYCREYVAKWESKNYVQLKPSALTWTPYVMGRSYPSNFELGPAINVLAPREEDDKPQLVTVVGTTEDTVMTNGHEKVGGSDSEARQEPHAGAGVTILESTEPNEGALVLVKDPHQPEDPAPADNAQPNGVSHAVASHPSDSRNGATTTPADDANNDSVAWISAYKEIPPTRFEVFPPATNARLARARSTVARAPAVRIAGSARRPAARRRTSGIKRSAGPKPRSATKRKSGGTGRGPGRWPKGTKKSDYGNADSGPGLPPGWIEKKAVSVATASPAGSVKRRGGSKNGSQPSRGEEEDGSDTVEVSTPKRATTGGSKGRATPRSAKGNDDDDSVELIQGDLEMVEDEDKDA